MKVVEEKKWAHPFTCAGCQSVLQAETDDVRITVLEDSPNYFWVECPSCGTQHKIPEREVPPKAQGAARAKHERR